MRIRVAIVAVVLGVCAPRVAADPVTPAPGVVLHVASPSHLVSDGGTDLRLPPSYVLDEPTFAKLDLEVRRLQDVETRLTAENASLRAQPWHPGWKSIASAVVAGIAIGAYVGHKI